MGKVFVSFLNDFSEKISNVTLEKCFASDRFFNPAHNTEITFLPQVTACLSPFFSSLFVLSRSFDICFKDIFLPFLISQFTRIVVPRLILRNATEMCKIHKHEFYTLQLLVHLVRNKISLLRYAFK